MCLSATSFHIHICVAGFGLDQKENTEKKKKEKKKPTLEAEMPAL